MATHRPHYSIVISHFWQKRKRWKRETLNRKCWKLWKVERFFLSFGSYTHRQNHNEINCSSLERQNRVSTTRQANFVDVLSGLLLLATAKMGFSKLADNEISTFSRVRLPYLKYSLTSRSSCFFRSINKVLCLCGLCPSSRAIVFAWIAFGFE